MKILVTGFQPFNGEDTNPALEVVKNLPSEIKGAKIIPLEIPTVFGQSSQIVYQAMKTHEPDVVVHIGQAGGRGGISIERLAMNLDDASIPDNQGQQPIDEPICPDGPAAYFSSLPIKAIVKGIQAAGLPAGVSNTAGSYVCNHLMYQTLHYIEKHFPTMTGGFIHIPYLMEQVVNRNNLPAMSLTDMIKAITVAIEVIVDFHGHQDIKETGGHLH